MKSPNYFLLFFCSFISLHLHAQSPVNAFIQKKGKGSIAVSYNTESYDEVYLVPKKIQGVPIFNKITLKSGSIYATYGVNDKLNLVLNVPYIQSQGAASEQVLKNLNYENTRAGFQDVSAYVKYAIGKKETLNGTYNFIAAAGLKTPLSKYRVDDGLQSIVAIGNRSSSLNALAIGSFKHISGFFVSGQASYCLKNKQVPNAVITELKAGLIQSHYYVDAFIATQTSMGGTDILAEGFQGFFPSTRVNYTRIGLNIFIPLPQKFGLCGGTTLYLDGRNLGKSTGFYGAISYAF